MLEDKKAEYGTSLIDDISKKLTGEYGQGFSRPNIFKMICIFETFQDEKIFSTVSRKLSWSHLIEIIQIKVSHRSASVL